MKKNSIEERFDLAIYKIQSGETPYWDADQIIDFAEYAEDENFIEDYETIVNYGRKLHPNNVELYIKHCRFYFLTNKNEQTLSELQAIPNPHLCEYDELYITSLFLMKRYKEALAYSESIINSGVDYAEDLLRSIHEFNMADVEDDEFREEFLLLCMHFFPDNTAFQDDYCEILSEKKQYKEAILLTLRIIEKHPYNYEAWFNLGRLYACSDQYAMALEAIEFARSCDKEDFPDLELDNLHAFCLFKEEGVESLIKKWNHCLSVSYSEDKLTDILMDVYYILDKHVEGYNFLNNRITLNISSIPFHAMTIYF